MVRKVWISVLLSLCIFSTYAESPTTKESTAKKKNTLQLQKFNQFYDYLYSAYLEDVDMKPLIERAIESILKELDPHSTYISAEEMKSVDESIKGEFSGIGIEFAVVNDTIMVVNTIAGAPAQSVGVVPNDRIIEVDGKSAIGFSEVDVPKYIRGKRGSKVNIKVARRGTPHLDFTITRDNIPIHTIDAAYMLDKTTGYIKVNRFGQTTMDEFRESFAKMPHLKDLVVDLRGNGGGLLSQAIEMANFFLDKGSLIVSTEGRAFAPHQYKATRDGEFTKGGVIILVDSNSASASEIVAGAIQDWDRGVIIGETTFGKGLVQRQFPLVDGSSTRITIARYHTPSGRVIQRPYENGKSDEYFSHKTAVDSVENSSHSEKSSHKTLKLGRSVLGGGGITPEIKLARDTVPLSPLYSTLIRRGIINEFAIQYLDRERTNLLNGFLAHNNFVDRYEVDAKMISELLELAKKREIFSKELPFVEVDTTALLNEANTYIKAVLAQKLYNSNAFYEVLNREDTTTFNAINRVLKGLKDQKRYNFY
ncbi:MAG: S41 family peptidase [Rikenellaceae bacterium]